MKLLKNSSTKNINTDPKGKDYATFKDFPESTQRVRRNLLIFALISLFLNLSHAEISGNIDSLGLTLANAKSDWIKIFLLAILLYHFFHFIWLAIEHFKYNRILLSRVLEENKRGNVGEIDLEDWAWNLYSWWRKVGSNSFEKFSEFKKIEEKLNYDNEDEDISRLKKQIESLKIYLEKFKKENVDHNELSEYESAVDNFKIIIYNQSYFAQKRQNFISASDLLIKSVEDLKRIQNSNFKQIKIPLEKFDQFYKNYTLSTRLRLWIFETGLPIILGLGALVSFWSFFTKSIISKFLIKFYLFPSY
jgi:hypothetical protein